MTEEDTRRVIGRHCSGPFKRVSGWVGAVRQLDPHALVSEYAELVHTAPTRSRAYLVDHDLSGRKDESNREEDLLATDLWQRRTTFESSVWGECRVIDFQTPLNDEQDDGWGKVDLLGVGDGLYAIELKVRGSQTPDSPAIAMLEVVGYCAALEKNRHLIDSEVERLVGASRGGPLRAIVLAPEDYWEYWNKRTDDLTGVLDKLVQLVVESTDLLPAFASFVPAEVTRTRVVDLSPRIAL